MSKLKTVLIADDSEAYLTYLGSIMKKMGFNVVLAKDGVELLVKVEEKKPDLIMLDIMMSRLDGVKTLSFLKENKDTAGIPVIMITADASAETVSRCKDLGSQAYMVKPVYLNDLHEMLQNHIYAPLALGYNRGYMRAIYYDNVNVTCQGETSEFQSESLSEGGIFIFMDSPLPVGAEVVVTLNIDQEKTISLSGSVIFHNKFRSGKEQQAARGIAVEFTEQNKDKMLFIHELVRGLLTVPFNVPKSMDKP